MVKSIAKRASALRFIHLNWFLRVPMADWMADWARVGRCTMASGLDRLSDCSEEGPETFIEYDDIDKLPKTITLSS